MRWLRNYFNNLPFQLLCRKGLVRFNAYFIDFGMFIVTLYSYQNPATFPVVEIWVLGPPFFMPRGPTYGENLF